MENLVVWVGFLGSWLLFMGPIYQAALELSQENDLRDELGGAREAGRDRVSAWWWLAPPVHYVLQRQRSRRFRDDLMNHLSPDRIEALVVYLNKATGWLYVGTGGLLIALGETGQLTDHYDWSPLVFAALCVVMALLSVINVAVRMSRGLDIVRSQRAQGADAP